MMKTIEDYSKVHCLEFSTDPVPSKCKTKCIAFLKKERNLPSVHLNGNPLPWSTDGIHLGNNFENSYNGLRKDIKIKRASFINKSCELLQEFHFPDPRTFLEVK